jgi:hypothetical protein
MHSLVKLALVAAAATSVASCGGSNSDAEAPVTAAAQSRPTKAAFIARADALCRRSDDEEAPLIYAAAADLTTNGPKLLEVLDRKHRTLSRLAPPAGDDEQWAQMLAAIAANIDRYRRNVANAKKGLGTSEDTSRAIGNLTDSMRAYGFVWCP